MLTPTVAVVLPLLAVNASKNGMKTMPNKMPKPWEILLAISCFNTIG
jgi:hypothetical protein